MWLRSRGSSAAGWLTVVTAAGVLAAACGSSAPTAAEPTPGPGIPASSSAALAAVRSALFRALAETWTVSITATGSSVFGLPAQVSGSGRFDFRNSSGSLTLSTGGRSRRGAVFVPGAVYVEPAGSPVLEGKSWLRVGFGDARTLVRDLPRLPVQVETINPAFILSQAFWGSSEATRVGSDANVGSHALRYELAVNPAQALVNATGADPGFALALGSEVVALRRVHGAAATPRTLRVQASVWIDDGGRLLQVETQSPVAGAGDVRLRLLEQAGLAKTLLPPPNAVLDLSAILPSGERENQNGGDSDGG